jgi:iron complex outermembrane receptor protein
VEVWKRRWVRFCIGFALLCLCSAALQAAEPAFDFRIPRSDAGSGLSLFARQSDTPLLFLSDQVRNRTTNPVHGTYTVREALDILLRDTGMSGSFNQSGVLTLSVAEPEQQERGEAMNQDRGIFARLAALVVAAASSVQAAPVGAQDSAPRALEEVVVTAQKREESLQDVGIAITALSEDRIVDAQVSNVQDLQGMAPGLTLGESFGFAQIMIRGVGTDNPFAGGDPSVAMHVDGAVIGQSSAQLGSLFDIQRIEVLRGPQGTLYGRNTTGGSINVVTNKPSLDLTGYSRFTVGNYDLYQFDGAVGGPLSEELLGRLALKIVDRGGYGDNLATGGDIDDASRQSVRGQLQWLPTDAFDALLAVEYHREDDNNYMPKFRAGSYPDATDPRLFPQPAAGTRASDPYDIHADTPIQNEREQWSVTATLDWQLNDRFRLTSISNYQDFEKVPQQDFDMTESPFYTQSEQIETWQASEELQLHIEGEGVNGMVGLYYYTEEIESDNRLYQAIPVPPCGPVTNDLFGYPITDLCFHFRGEVEAEAAAAFANFNVDLTDTVTLNLGGRYSYERREGVTDRWIVPGLPAALTFEDSGSFNDFSPRVGIEWTPVDALLLYATYAEGFKSGILLSGQTTPLLDPETVETYEVGMKGRFLDNRVQLNGAAFFYDYTDLQLGRSVPAGATGFTLVYENAAEAEVKGAEVEVSWLVNGRFRLDGSVTYLDAEFTDYATTDPFDTVLNLLGLAPPAMPQQLEGNRLVQAPEWSWTARAEYDFALPTGGWNGRLAVEARHKSQVYFTQFNYDALGQDGVTTYDAFVKLTSPDEAWSVNLWGRNLSDKEIYTGTFIINGSRTNAGMLAPPRTYGATVGYSF